MLNRNTINISTDTMTIEKLNFIILGAAKSGTTTVQSYLVNHPRVHMSRIKEPEFFSKQENWDRGFEWYDDLFTGASEDQIIGEASTTYTRWPHTLDSSELISRHTNVQRFIYIMRHPVDRAYSHYSHHMRKKVTRTFEEALAQNEIYFDCGNYIMQIERYLRFYNRKNFLFLFTDDLHSNPEAVLKKVQKFLDLEHVDLVNKNVIKMNSKDDDHYLRHQTFGRLRKSKLLSPVIDQVPAHWRNSAFEFLRNSKFGKKISSSNIVPPLSTETRKKLLEKYAPQNQKLSDFLKLDLPNWHS